MGTRKKKQENKTTWKERIYVLIAYINTTHVAPYKPYQRYTAMPESFLSEVGTTWLNVMEVMHYS